MLVYQRVFHLETGHWNSKFWDDFCRPFTQDRRRALPGCHCCHIGGSIIFLSYKSHVFASWDFQSLAEMPMAHGLLFLCWISMFIGINDPGIFTTGPFWKKSLQNSLGQGMTGTSPQMFPMLAMCWSHRLVSKTGATKITRIIFSIEIAIYSIDVSDIEPWFYQSQYTSRKFP